LFSVGEQIKQLNKMAQCIACSGEFGNDRFKIKIFEHSKGTVTTHFIWLPGKFSRPSKERTCRRKTGAKKKIAPQRKTLFCTSDTNPIRKTTGIPALRVKLRLFIAPSMLALNW